MKCFLCKERPVKILSRKVCSRCYQKLRKLDPTYKLLESTAPRIIPKLTIDEYHHREMIGRIARKHSVLIVHECSCEEYDRKENHHPDYKYPLLVQRLCRKCHKAAHRQMKQLEVSNYKHSENHIRYEDLWHD